MSKPTFTDEFKQGVVQYVFDHPDVSIATFARYKFVLIPAVAVIPVVL